MDQASTSALCARQSGSRARSQIVAEDLEEGRSARQGNDQLGPERSLDDEALATLQSIAKAQPLAAVNGPQVHSVRLHEMDDASVGLDIGDMQVAGAMRAHDIDYQGVTLLESF